MCVKLKGSGGGNLQHNLQHGSRDSVVGMAARYRLDGPGIEHWWG
jgi:hypothetical protein